MRLAAQVECHAGLDTGPDERTCVISDSDLLVPDADLRRLALVPGLVLPPVHAQAPAPQTATAAYNAASETQYQASRDHLLQYDIAGT